MNRDLVNLYSFLAGVCLAVMMCLPFAARASTTVQPSIPNWVANAHGIAAGLKAFNAGGLPYNPSNYSAPASVAVGGRTVPLTAKVPLSPQAGKIVKSALRLNPTAIAGTLAAGWLLDQGFEWLDGEWQKTVPATEQWSQQGCGTADGCGLPLFPTPEEAAQHACTTYYGGGVSKSYFDGPYTMYYECWPAGGAASYRIGSGLATTGPATESDWDALPDPSATVAPELPTAPYMGDKGAPVGTPTYDPQTVDTGAPFKMPDGSTVQPKATITDAGGGKVTIVTYNQTTINNLGEPVTDAPPVETDEKPDQCEKYPESLGCLNLGEAPAVDLSTEVRDIPLITPVTVGGAGSCPAPITASFMGQALEFSFDFPCQAAVMLKPLILALAWFAAGLIFIQGVRQ